MATTKLDLLRDILTDSLIDLDFNLDMSDDGDGQDEILRNEIIEDMLLALEDYDQIATERDFTVRIVMDKTVDTTYGEIIPGENTKESEVL